MSKKNKKEPSSGQKTAAGPPDRNIQAQAGSKWYPKNYTWTTIIPGTIIIIGIMLMAIGDPWADYVVTAGVGVQLAIVIWQIRQVKIGRAKAQAGRS